MSALDPVTSPAMQTGLAIAVFVVALSGLYMIHFATWARTRRLMRRLNAVWRTAPEDQAKPARPLGSYVRPLF